MRQYVGISSIAFDPDGARALPVYNDPAVLRQGARRATRTATLDGGCVVYDTGYADTDRSITIETDGSYMDWITYMVRTYRLVRLSTEDGVFLAVPARHSSRDGRAVINLDITQRIA